jgi:alkylated DNA repair protein alkB family protein 1
MEYEIYLMKHHIKRNSVAYDGTKPLSETIFRIEEKKFMHLTYNDIKNEIIDFANLSNCNCDLTQYLNCNNGVYTFSPIQGLFILPNILSPDEQKYWINQALNNYTVSNNYPNNIVSFDETKITNCYKKNIRWSRLGEKYDWNYVSYQKTEHNNFPQDLSIYTQKIISIVDNADTLKNNVIYIDYKPEVAFVNYYPVGTSMMAHQDKSEETYDKPLVSMSLGCSCIFLIGTNNRDDKPYAFMLRSGDIICMTGESRLAFHGVPKIYDDCPQELVNYDSNMDKLRININVRQVHCK